MTEFQFAFLCLFALSIVIMIAYTMHRDRQEETTIWTTGSTTADQEEEKFMPVTYTTTLQDFDPELGGGQTALEFARAYSRVACLAAEQMVTDKAITGESKKDQAVAVLRTFIRAQGHDPDDENLSAALPYLIDAAFCEEAKPLF